MPGPLIIWALQVTQRRAMCFTKTLARSGGKQNIEHTAAVWEVSPLADSGRGPDVGC